MSLEKIKTILKNHNLIEDSSVIEIQKLQNSANETFVITLNNERVTKVFFKMYVPFEGRAVKSCELWIRDILPLSFPVPKILAMGVDEEKNYLISAFVDGDTLLEKVNQPSVLPSDLVVLSKQLINFIRDCSIIPIEGFGSLDRDSRKGQYSTLTEFIKDNIKNAYNLYKEGNENDEEIKGYVEKYLRFLNQYVEDNCDYFDEVSSRLIPLDLNLNNFVVTTGNKILMTDLESFAGGDPLLAFGEWYGHVYHSPFGEFFVEEYEKFSENEQKNIHFYALLGNFNVFCFCVAHHIPNLKKLTPWGNPNSFLHLMNKHMEKINDKSLVLEKRI